MDKDYVSYTRAGRLEIYIRENSEGVLEGEMFWDGVVVSKYTSSMINLMSLQLKNAKNYTNESE